MSVKYMHLLVYLHIRKMQVLYKKKSKICVNLKKRMMRVSFNKMVVTIKSRNLLRLKYCQVDVYLIQPVYFICI